MSFVLWWRVVALAIVLHLFSFVNYKLFNTTFYIEKTFITKFFEWAQIKQFWWEFSNQWYLISGVRKLLYNNRIIVGILNCDNIVLNYRILQAKTNINNFWKDVRKFKIFIPFYGQTWVICRENCGIHFDYSKYDCIFDQL